MRFLIVTPSSNQLDYLKRCIASVRDQVSDGALKRPAGLVKNVETPKSSLNDLNGFTATVPVAVHHHIQDACSTDGTVEFLKEYIARQPATSNYHLTFASEADEGMYDAVRRGWQKGHGSVRSERLAVNGEDIPDNSSQITDNRDDTIVAWLNCDEQYLPGTLQAVAGYFDEHPAVDVFFGDALVVRPDGSLLCARRAQLPERRHMLTSYLTVFSAAMFVRGAAVQKDALYPDPGWKILGDVELIDRMMGAGVRFGMTHRFLASFTDSGENISLTGSTADREREALAARLPPRIRTLRAIWILRHRVRKLFAGGYGGQPLIYSIFMNDLLQRTEFSVARPPAVWKGRL